LIRHDSLPWLIGGAILILFSLWIPLLRTFTLGLGAGAPVTALFAGVIIFLLIQNLLFSGALSRQTRQPQYLVIALALQQEAIRSFVQVEKTRELHPQAGE
jgi:hypothetical protein